MCSNYRAASMAGIEALVDDGMQGDLIAGRDVWPNHEAPVLVRDKDTGRMRVETGIFGLVPHWARDRKITRSTYNARSETVAEKPSFRTAWAHANFCLIPVSWYYEPRYDADGKHPVRWAIRRKDTDTFCVAGLYWRPKGEGVTAGMVSFTMLTVNADEHPVLRAFHDPADEKRSIVHVEPAEYEAWLTASTELARVLLATPPAHVLECAPAPLPKRPSKSIPNAVAQG